MFLVKCCVDTEIEQDNHANFCHYNHVIKQTQNFPGILLLTQYNVMEDILISVVPIDFLIIVCVYILRLVYQYMS